MDATDVTAVSMVDRLDGPARWTIERDAHVLILHEAGSYHWLETWLDGRRTSLGDPLPGEMWLAPAGHHFLAAAQGGAARYIEVGIPARLLDIAPATRAVAAYRDPVLADKVRRLLDGRGGGRPFLAMLSDVTHRMVARPLARPMADRIDMLMAQIQKRLEHPLIVEELAAEVGISINSLITHFARATGFTPAQYIMRQRLRRAGWFLLNRPLTVAEIAFATGFSSHAHLCVAFRRKLGMSPGEWRRRHASAIRVDNPGPPPAKAGPA